MVTRQYDGVADAPVYVGNVPADVNALLGAYYLHGNGNYFDVDPNAAGNIVTTSANGNMTDILVPAAPGALPLFVPLAQAGVPQAILVALDPAVRAIIETGYDRTGDPSQQVMFALLPPPSAWPADAQAVAAECCPDRAGTARRRGGQFSQPARPSGVTTDHDVADAAPGIGHHHPAGAPDAAGITTAARTTGTADGTDGTRDAGAAGRGH